MGRLPHSERVELELFCLDCSNVAVALHVMVAGTPIRSFSSPACRPRNVPSDGPAASPLTLRRSFSPISGAACEERLEAAAAESGGPTAAAVCEASPAAAVEASAVQQAAASVPLDGVPSIEVPSTAELSAASEAASGGSLVAAAPLSPSGLAPVLQPATDPVEPASVSRTAGAAGAAAGVANSKSAAATQANHVGAAVGAAEAGVPPAVTAELQGGTGAGIHDATLTTMMGMLQRLLNTSSLAAVPQQQKQQPEAGPASVPAPTTLALVAPPSPAAASSRAGSGPVLSRREVDKLLSLELEVVQLQQDLQIAQMEFTSRTAQLHSLKQRADAAEQRAQAADERAAGVERHMHQLERQLSDARCQLSEAASRHQQESAQHASRLAAAASLQHAAEEEATRLRQQLEAARQQLEAARLAAEAEQAQLHRAAAAQHAEWQQREAAQHAEWQQQLASQQAQGQQREASQQSQWQQRVAASRHETEQLRTEVATACRTLRAMGIAPNKVFGQQALLAAGVTDGMHSPPDSPLGPAQQPSTVSQRRGLPPQVPRLQLSSISLQQLTAQASPKPPPAAAAGPGEHGASPVLPTSTQKRLQQTAGDNRYATVGVSTDGAAALGGVSAHASFSARAPPPVVVPSPTASVQQSCELNLAMLTARSRQLASPAQQELLATARQWQLTARSAAAAEQAQEEGEENLAASRYYDALPSARASARGPAPPLHGFGGGSGGAARASCTPRHLHTPRPPVGGTPLRGTPLQGTPGGRLPLRLTYGQQASFQEIKAAYHAVMSSETDRASKWARSVFSSTSAVDADPARVDHMVQSLLQLFSSNGVPIPLQKCGQCQYQLPGGSKLALRLVNGRLMARAGAGQTMDIFAWLEKQPVAQQQQHGVLH